MRNWRKIRRVHDTYIKNDEFMALALNIGNNIKRRKYNFDKIGLLGISRGGLPLLTVIAQFLEIEDVYTAKVKRVYSDTGEYTAEVIHSDLGNKESFIVLDDVVSTGKSIRALGDHLNEKHRDIEKVFCIYGDKDIERETGIEVYTELWKSSNETVRFPWEKEFYVYDCKNGVTNG